MSNQWGNIPDWVYDTAKSLMEALKTVDSMTYAHCMRVGGMSKDFAKALGLNDYEQRLSEFSGMFHDIGKMGIDQDIIYKPGKLDSREYEIMKIHPVLSEQIVNPLATVDFMKQLLPAIRGHHERVDGNGYPDNLTGDAIPLSARIILIVDTYDAMSHTRSYRKGLPDEVIYAELKRCSGTQFDAHLVQHFLQAHKSWSMVDEKSETHHLITKKIA